MQQATLCFLMKDGKLLLGMKKRGFGEGKFNGYGGKPDNGETIEQAAVRELFEESNVKTNIEHLEKVGELNFAFPVKKDWDQTVHVFIVKQWENEAIETEEMKPEWFEFKDIPYSKMWDDDKIWLPKVLEGKKLDADFFFGEDNSTIKEFDIREL